MPAHRFLGGEGVVFVAPEFLARVGVQADGDFPAFIAGEDIELAAGQGAAPGR